WTLYVIKVGGDFMELRMFVPVIPLLMLLVVQMLSQLEPWAARVALVAGLIACSAYHGFYYNGVADIESIPGLRAWLEYPDRSWIMTGRALGEVFGDSAEPVWIATTAAGAIPFYSGLPTLDMFGLSDRYVARHGVLRRSSKPGHQRV